MIPNKQILSSYKFTRMFVVGTEIHGRPKLPKLAKTLMLFWSFTPDAQPPKEINQHWQLFGGANPKIIIDKVNEGKYCHLVAYYILPNGTPSQSSQVLSFMASTI